MNTDENIDILHYINSADSITIYIDGYTHDFDKNTQEYSDINDAIKIWCSSSHEIPALGVSIDSETRDAMTQDIWLELCYTDTKKYNDMPFDKLLIKVQKDDYGCNIIRHYDSKYDGRCYYLNTAQDMTALYSAIKKILDT